MFLFCIFLILGLSNAVQIEDVDILSLPVYFDKSVYRAKVVDRKVELLDGPILLHNCDFHDFNILTISDNDKYYTIPNSDTESSCHFNCSICFSAFVRENVKPKDILYDTITIEAQTEIYGITTTTIIIVYSSEYDPYKLVYDINGTEYVILNYFYFKLFLLIIIVTGILLLVLEIREVILKYKGKEYSQIDNQINYI